MTTHPRSYPAPETFPTTDTGISARVGKHQAEARSSRVPPHYRAHSAAWWCQHQAPGSDAAAHRQDQMVLHYGTIITALNLEHRHFLLQQKHLDRVSFSAGMAMHRETWHQQACKWSSARKRHFKPTGFPNKHFSLCSRDNILSNQFDSRLLFQTQAGTQAKEAHFTQRCIQNNNIARW